MARPKLFESFREVQAELERSGSALFRDKDGFEALVIKNPYAINYIHSYAEDTPFFLGLSEGRLLGSQCTGPKCEFLYATPRGHCMVCGTRTRWQELPLNGKLHSWTTCHFGSEAFLKETPYNLGLVEFEGAGSLLLARIKEATESELYVGMPVEARFDARPKFSITDIWFVPVKGGSSPARR
ncbi:MAG: Zn-ribbon domain-containing OB-fold protein [Thermoplasmata archaeon]|nr:Zn-ribbon domain-containing OB-fold protein [Thermoplasmata archaeon]MCI4341249.1 Zn-ribbon domain-containing OB-fold protein [Thermoplasmata archaeon]